MKKILVIFAFVMFGIAANAQEAKPTESEKTEKKQCDKGKKCCSKDHAKMSDADIEKCKAKCKAKGKKCKFDDMKKEEEVK